jgi:hypothetical protein
VTIAIGGNDAGFAEGCEAEAKKVRDDDSVTKYTR